MSGEYRLNKEELKSHYNKLCSDENVKRLKEQFKTKSDEKTSVLLKEYRSELKDELESRNERSGDIYLAEYTAFNRVLWKYPKEKSSRQHLDNVDIYLKEFEKFYKLVDKTGHYSNLEISRARVPLTN
ncbi:MAG: hypothetical protein E2O79_06085 [Caldithrix sp.]|nr:MAG: hypothetical protein E2O79_06085 [Caldithrix sp.]